MSIAIIPARGGSRRIPGKNIKEFHGKPIICYSIETAKESGLFESVIVSTDDHDIAEVAKACEAEVRWRSTEFCENGVGTQEVMAHELMGIAVHPDAIACCIYPCAPLLTCYELKQAFHIVSTLKAPYVFATTNNGKDAGQFYMGRSKTFVREISLSVPGVMAIVMDTIDINTPEDWEKAEALYESRK